MDLISSVLVTVAAVLMLGLGAAMIVAAFHYWWTHRH